MNSSEDREIGSVSQLVQHWDAQESPAVERIYLDYFPKLQTLTRRILGGLPGANIDAEDAAQSAIKSFCRYMRKQEQPNQKHRDDVWRILCKIAARKAIKHRRKRTHGDPNADLKAMTDLEMRPEDWPQNEQLAEIAVGEFDESITAAIAKLDESLQPFDVLMLQELTQEEIAKQMNCSRRTVIRKIEIIKELLKKFLGEDNSGE